MDIFRKIDKFRQRQWGKIVVIGKIILFAAYLIYFGFALRYHVGNEESWMLIGCTVFGVCLIVWNLLKSTKCHSKFEELTDSIKNTYLKGNRRVFIRRILYFAMTAFMIVYVIVKVALINPENLRSLVGLAGFPIFLYLYSNNKKKINWHTIYWTMAIQFLMALIILKTYWGAAIIRFIGDRLTDLVQNGDAGSEFIFGKKWKDHPFAFGAMSQVFVLIVGMSVLTYLGVIQFTVETVGSALAYIVDTSAPESINAIGNIFLHVPESVMLVQQYIADMTPSQLFVTYTGGLSTVGGVSLVIFMAAGVPAAPLIAASAMSAPAALTVSKLVFPSHSQEEIPVPVQCYDKDPSERDSFLRHPKSLMDSIILGIKQSVALVVQAVAFIMTFVIILELVNNTVRWFGNRIGVRDLTIQYIFSYAFYPFAFMMGARLEDCQFIGELLGIRTFGLAVVAYPKLGPIIQNGIKFRKYIADNQNNTWSKIGQNVFLENINQTLVGGVIEERSEIIATYALCGSAAFAIMGLIIGSFEVMVPHRIEEITKHILRAMIAGTVASYLTACFAGKSHGSISLNKYYS